MEDQSDFECPASVSQLAEAIAAFEAVHGKRPTIVASDMLLMLIDRWTHRKPVFKDGDSPVIERRRHYENTRYHGCKITLGMDYFDLT